MGNTISSDVKKILERLYNLKSFDSVVLRLKQTEIDSIESLKSEDANMEKELVANIEDYTDNYLGCGNSYDNLVAGIDLKELKETKQLDTLEELFSELSETISEMKQADKNKSESELRLNEVKARIKQAETNLQELELQREDILKYQEALTNYVQRALKLDTGITVGEIHDLLVRLGFEEGSSDIELAAQLIIFPKTGLIEYDLSLNESSIEDEGKSISDVFAEAIKEETYVFSEIEESEEEDSLMSFALDDLEEDNLEDSVQKINLDYVLSELDLDPMEFTNRDKELMEQNLNPELFAININTLKRSGLHENNERIIYDYPSFLWDNELKNKLEILTGEV